MDAAHAFYLLQETEGLELPANVITAGVQAVLEGTASAAYYVVEEASTSSAPGAGGSSESQPR